MALTKRFYVNFARHQPIVNNPAVTQIGLVTDATVNYWHAGDRTLECRITAANADIVPTLALNASIGTSPGTTGWTIPNDNTANDGIEVGQGILADPDLPNVFKVGTHPAFELSVKFAIPDVSDYDVAVVGFRKAAAYGASTAPTDYSSAVLYTDAAGFNVNAGAIYTFAGVNQTGAGTGTYTSTDSTLTWADNAMKTLTVKVSSAGVVTFYVDGTVVGTPATGTFDTGDLMIPFIAFTKGSNASDTPPVLVTYSCGLQ